MQEQGGLIMQPRVKLADRSTQLNLLVALRGLPKEPTIMAPLCPFRAD